MTVGVAHACPPFLLGFDVLAPASDAVLDDAFDRGLRWGGRYLNNLTPAERDRFFARGLGILPYTEAMTGEPLDAATGVRYGVAMSARAASLEMPGGVHVGIDLESPMSGSLVGEHVNAMADALVAHKLSAALYVGAPQPLRSHELFLLKPNRYIKGAGRIVDAYGALAEPDCGWAGCGGLHDPLPRMRRRARRGGRHLRVRHRGASAGRSASGRDSQRLRRRHAPHGGAQARTPARPKGPMNEPVDFDKLATDVAAVVVKLGGLVRLATNRGATLEERRTAAMTACDLLASTGALEKVEKARQWIHANRVHLQRAQQAAAFLSTFRGR